MTASAVSLDCSGCGAPVAIERGSVSTRCRHCAKTFSVDARVRPRSERRFNPLVIRVGAGGDTSSLQEALAAADDGAKILVEPGVYEERIVIRRVVHLAASEGPGTVTLRPPAAELARTGGHGGTREAMRTALDALQRHRQKRWRFGIAHREEEARLAQRLLEAKRAFDRDFWALNAPLVSVRQPATLEGLRIESSGWNEQRSPTSLVEACASARSLLVLDTEFVEQSGKWIIGLDIDFNLTARVECCSFRRFSSQGASAVRFSGVFSSGGSLACDGCTFEHNFAGVTLSGGGSHTITRCMFRSNTVGIVRAVSEETGMHVALEGRENVFEGNQRDLARLAR